MFLKFIVNSKVFLNGQTIFDLKTFSKVFLKQLFFRNLTDKFEIKRNV